MLFLVAAPLPWVTVWVWVQAKKLPSPPTDYQMIVDELLSGPDLHRAVRNTERAFSEFQFQWTRVKEPASEAIVRTDTGSRRQVSLVRNDRIPYRARSYRDGAGRWVIEVNTRSWNALSVAHELLHLVQALPRPQGAVGFVVNSLLDDLIDAEILARLIRSRLRTNRRSVSSERRP